MNTVVIKIPSSVVPSQSKHLDAAVELRKWCHEHVKKGWRSFFLAATEHNQQAMMDNNKVSFIGFSFDDPKEAMKFKLWAGNERG